MNRISLTALAAALSLTGGCLPSAEQVRNSADDAGAHISSGLKKPDEWSFALRPTAKMIPDGPVTGMANGRSFAVKTVIFQPFFDNWNLGLYAAEAADPLDIVGEGEYISVELPRDIEAGRTYTHPMEYGDGYFQIQSPDSPSETTSWNAENAWVLEITSWDVRPYDPEGDLFQTAGTASGRIYVSYKGSGDFKNSGAAGTFENAVVRYMGDPGW
ncbi:MAG TPA: hypothetical protein PK636_00550 [bacterium]|nr:hypothetical protein [bacterium]HPJ71155.1 hypothetical protein [bacterium]HPQ66037.1 hypothetical protein [bacterium]